MYKGSVAVFVIGVNGKRLMPTTPRKARLLLKAGHATVYQRRPFTIQLTRKTSGYVQPCALGVDTGSQHIGIGVVRLAQKQVSDPQSETGTRQMTEATVLYRGEIALRSTMEKRKLMETRKEYRRGRRYRKVRYRHPKFRHATKRVWQQKTVTRKDWQGNRHTTHWVKVPTNYTSSRPAGWLPPSIQSKVDQHNDWIRRYLNVLPEGTQCGIELARFDTQRMKDPSIHGELYQKGQLYDYENVRAFVFARDGYKCAVCEKALGTKDEHGRKRKGVAHHILLRKEGATDQPEWLRTVCSICHTASGSHKPGSVLYDWAQKGKPYIRGYRDATFMNILAARLKDAFPDAWFTYGNITKVDRERFGLSKTHANDGTAIAAHDADWLVCTCSVIHYKQVRSKKRSLHEATPRKGIKAPNREARRNRKNTRRSRGFQLWDKVSCHGRIGWISGFASKGTCARLVDADGEYMTVGSQMYSNGKPKTEFPLSALQLLYHNNNWLVYGGERSQENT